MKKTALLILLILSATLSALADNYMKMDDLCFEYLKQIDNIGEGTDSAFVVIGKMVARAESINDPRAVTIGYNCYIKHYAARGEVEAMKDAADKARAKALEYDRKMQYFQTYWIEFTYFQSHDMPMAALEVAGQLDLDAHRMDDPNGLQRSFHIMAVLYESKGAEELAKEYYKKSIAVLEESLPTTAISAEYARLASLYPMGSDSCMYYLSKAEEKLRVPNDSVETYRKLMMAYAIKGDWQNYDKYRDKVDNLDTKTKTEADEDIASALISRNWRSAIDMCSRLGENLEAVRLKTEIGDKSGDQSLMLSCTRNEMQFRKSLLENSSMSELAEMATRVDLSMAQHEAAMKAEQVRQMNNKIKISCILLVILAIFITMLLVIKSRDRKMKEQIELAETLRKANDIKTSFVQNMSHEIRTPLNAVVGFAQILSLPDGFNTPEEKEQYAGYVNSSSAMLTMLIDDILDIADAENGNYRIELSDAPCNMMCNVAIKNVEYRTPPDVRMYFTTEVDDSFEIHTDPRRVQQVLINYLTNACKHTEKGEIHVHVSLSENPGSVTFSVTDTGTGVPPEKAEAIFERFTKLDAFVQGTGLGLNICRTVADKLGGQVSLDTSYTGGARFLFILPLDK